MIVSMRSDCCHGRIKEKKKKNTQADLREVLAPKIGVKILWIMCQKWKNCRTLMKVDHKNIVITNPHPDTKKTKKKKLQPNNNITLKLE